MPLQQPRLEFDPALPIASEVETIRGLLARHQVVVVERENSSGERDELAPELLPCVVAGIARRDQVEISLREEAVLLSRHAGDEAPSGAKFWVFLKFCDKLVV